MGDLAGAHRPGACSAVGTTAGSGPGGDFLQSVLAGGKKFLRGVGGVDHVGIGFHLIGPDHGDNRQPGRQILIDSSGDHVAVGLIVPEEIEQYLTLCQMFRYLHQGTGGAQYHVGQTGKPAQEGVVLSPA